MNTTPKLNPLQQNKEKMITMCMGDEFKQALAQVLPKILTADRMSRVALFLLKNNPKLWECKPLSVIGSITQIAQMGLDMSPTSQLVHLVPYKQECTVIIGYKGFLELMRRSNTIKMFQNNVVYENDVFINEMGSNAQLKHIASDTPGDLRYVYAHAHFKDGGEQWKVLNKAQIEKARKYSKSRNASPWDTHYEEMALKTAIRSFAKTMPSSTEDMRMAAILEEKADLGHQRNTTILKELNLFQEEIKQEEDQFEELALESAGFSFDEETGEIIEESETEKLEKSLSVDSVYSATRG